MEGINFLILLIIFSRVFVHAHSFNQIVFGTLLGLGVFMLFAYFIYPDTNKPEGLVYFIDIQFLYHIIIVIAALISVIVLYYKKNVDINQTG